jgi:predicted MFS family arabinose efflux permease
VRLFARLFRLIWGADVEPALRPLLAVSFVGTATFSAGWSFIGIWAIEELGATSKQLGAAYLIAAVAGFAVGYLGGHASDYVGRRPMILLGWGLLSATLLSFAFVGQNVLLGLGLSCMLGIGGSIGGGPTRRWSPTSCRRSGTKPAMRRCGSRTTSGSCSAHRSAGRS